MLVSLLQDFLFGTQDREALCSNLHGGSLCVVLGWDGVIASDCKALQSSEAACRLFWPCMEHHRAKKNLDIVSMEE